MRVITLPHEKVNLVWSTDWHIAAEPPGRRSDDYQAAILRKLKFIGELTHRLNGAALCGGDVFHVKNAKSPSNSLSLIAELITTLQEFPYGGVFGSVGNHDLSFDRMDSLPSQPLGVLIAAGVYYNLNEEPVVFTTQDFSVSVLVETFPYERGDVLLEHLLQVGYRPTFTCDAGEFTPTYRIAILHAYGEPGKGGTLFGEPKIGYDQVAHLDYDFMCWGHDHSRKETEQVGNITHVNLGSLARAALATDEVDRPVVAAILSFATDGVRYKEKEVPVTPLQIAFTTADKPMEKVAKSDAVKEFFAEMDEQVGDIETTDVREILETICPDEDKPVLGIVYEVCGI